LVFFFFFFFFGVFFFFFFFFFFFYALVFSKQSTGIPSFRTPPTRWRLQNGMRFLAFFRGPCSRPFFPSTVPPFFSLPQSNTMDAQRLPAEGERRWSIWRFASRLRSGPSVRLPRVILGTLAQFARNGKSLFFLLSHRERFTFWIFYAPPQTPLEALLAVLSCFTSQLRAGILHSLRNAFLFPQSGATGILRAVGITAWMSFPPLSPRLFLLLDLCVP